MLWLSLGGTNDGFTPCTRQNIEGKSHKNKPIKLPGTQLFSCD